MDLKSLLLCSDEKIVRVLRRTLGDMEIEVEHCTDPESALRFLTRERYEAIIVDCAGPGAASVLRGARSAPCNKRAVAVAILDPVTGLRSAFETGAHFILYKPVSVERAKSSFRAARALMKKERRRNTRVPVHIPVRLTNRESGVKFKVNTNDLGEGGLSVTLPQRGKPSGSWQVSFVLPGSNLPLEADAEFAWEGTGAAVGLRFQNPSAEFARRLGEWLIRNSPDVEKDDPPICCQLTDLSLGGCYLDISSPFPVSTRVTLSMHAAGVRLKTEGVVRVMYPEKGMGVEFIQTTSEHRALLEKFLGVLTANREVQPELTVEPEGLETEPQKVLRSADPSNSDSAIEEDALIGLFRNHQALSADSFLSELRKQRGFVPATSAATASV